MTENQQAPAATVGNTHRQARTSSGWLWCLGAVLWCLGAVAVAFLLLAAAFDLFSSKPLQIAHDTTYITAPLTADGKRVDYFAAIEQATRPANAATDENGYRVLVQHLGRHPDTDIEHFRAMCTKLGLDADAIQPDMMFEEPLEFLRAYVASDEFDKKLLDDLPDGHRYKTDPASAFEARLGRPWTLDDLPMMARWLEANGPALDLIGRAVRKPVFHIPMVRESEDELLIGLPDRTAGRIAPFGRGLGARANFRIGVGDIDGAVDDIITYKRLGRHRGHGATLVSLAAGIALERHSDAIGIGGSLEHPPGKEQLQRVAEAQEDLPPRGDLDQKFLFERFTLLDYVLAYAYGRGDVDGLTIFDILGVDWNIVARRLNEQFDRFTAAEESPFLPLTESFALVSRRVRSEQMADNFALLLIPDFDTTREALRRAACIEQIKRITLAMLLYEREHGTLPPPWTVDAGGHPLHSWRVLLLPYLGQHALYDAVRLDESWDSEHNRQFHGEDLAIYRCPSDPAAQPGQTTYSVVVGPEMPFEAGEGKRLADFGSQSDDMILLVERAQPVGWMEPAREIPQSAAEHGIRRHHTIPTASDAIASHHPGGAIFGLRNGAAEFLSLTMDAEAFNQMLRGTHEDKYRW